MAGNFFRGTTVDQDGRWGKSDEKLMAKMQKAGKFAAILDTKIDIKKVNIDIISRWVTERTIEVLGFEDEIVVNLVINMLQSDNLHGKKMQLDVTGFLEKGAGAFVEELWTLLVDAQKQANGIPEAFIRKKKEEILRRQQAIQMVTNAALQQTNSDNNSKGGRWGPSSAPITSVDGLSGAVEGNKLQRTADEKVESEDARKEDEERSRVSSHKNSDDAVPSSDRIDEDRSKGDRRDGDSDRHKGRDRSRSHDRRERDSDSRKHDRDRRRDSRDRGHDRERSRERERHHRDDRDRDRSRDRHRSRRDRDDRSDRDRDRKSDRRDQDRNRDTSDRHKSHRRERSRSGDNRRGDRRGGHRDDRRENDNDDRKHVSSSGRHSHNEEKERTKDKSDNTDRKDDEKSNDNGSRSHRDRDGDHDKKEDTNKHEDKDKDHSGSPKMASESSEGDKNGSEKESELRKIALASMRKRRNSESSVGSK